MNNKKRFYIFLAVLVALAIAYPAVLLTSGGQPATIFQTVLRALLAVVSGFAGGVLISLLLIWARIIPGYRR